MTERPTPACIDAETLAAFAEGRLPRAEMPAVLAHLEHCVRCTRALEEANAAVEPRAQSRVWWLAVAAAVVFAVAGVGVWRNASRPPTARLVALSAGDARSIEPRLSGGFAWAPYHGPDRAREERGDTRRMRLIGEAGDLVARADEKPTGESQHAAGVALALIESPLDAVERLRAAAALESGDARVWSDLAAAQYAAAMRLDRPSLYPEALASADRALRIDGRLPEALFNRALILERLALAQQAREAWQRYLEVDPSSPWAEEARRRMAQLPAVTETQLFRKELPRIEQAALAGDAELVQRLVDRVRQQARGYAEGETLGLWAEAHARGDETEAERQLAIAERVGEAVARLSGESLLRESVTAIRRADPRDRAVLAEAHTVYRRGRIAYSRQQLAIARGDLLRSAASFAAAGSPMAFNARYYAASTLFDQNDVAGAQAELQALRDDAAAHPLFLHVSGRTQWTLALCRMVDDDWPGALPHVVAAEAAFHRLGESSDEGFLATLHGDTLICLNRLDEGWRSRIRSFALLSRAGRGDRLPVSLGGAARMELRHGRHESARALMLLETDAIRAVGNDVLLVNALVRSAVMSADLGDDAGAAGAVREASVVAARIADPALRSRALNDVEFAAGAAALRADPRAASQRLTRAIEGYRERELAHFLPECHLLRARAAMRLGDASAAAADLESGIAALERHRAPDAGTGVFQASIALYREAVTLALDRGDVAGAFDYAERSRGTPERGVLATLRQRLAGTGAAVLELVVLRDEVVAFSVTAEGVDVARHRVTAERLAELSASELYDALIRPSEGRLARARSLIVVPDPRIEHVPFHALYDAAARKHLVEKLPVAVASAAAVLRADRSRRTPSRAVTLALRSGETALTVALPATERETAEVRGFYPDAIESSSATFAEFASAAARAEVIHIAGHTEAQGGAGETALVFADEERVSWRDVSRARFDDGAVVVLAACETLRRPRSPETFALSLGGGFLAAGASEVIGTLDPIRDNEAQALFRIVHRELAAGANAADAVRRAQMESISAGEAWRSVAVLTNRIRG